MGKTKNYKIDDTLEAETMRLAEHIRLHTPYDGDFDNKTLHCRFVRYSEGGKVCVKTFIKSSLFIVAQGAKKMIIGEEAYHVGKAQMLLLPVVLPVEIHSLQACQSKPYLSIGLDFDSYKIFEFASKMYPQGIHNTQRSGTSLVAGADIPIINAVNRLLLCLSNSEDIQYIAPLIMDEIVMRVLRSPIGTKIVQMGFTGSNMQGVIRAISWLGENFSGQVKIADLAKMAYMSESTFHKHFKKATSMTPLQYQKSLRLHEARRLMLSDSLDASAASGMVGEVNSLAPNSDCAVAAQNIMLAAKALQIGSCWISAAAVITQTEEGKKIIKKLGLPEAYAPFNSIALGYKKAERLNAPPRRDGVVTYIR